MTYEILSFLLDNPIGYKRLRARMLGDTHFEDLVEARKNDKRKLAAIENNIRVSLSRLKSNGLVENKEGFWSVTNLGKEKLKNEDKSGRKYKKIPETETNGRKMIAMFDIPEEIKHSRGWLRRELIYLGFEPLQKSVWIGPAPLPKEFAEVLKETKLLQYLNFFEAKETEIA
ncbi:MAG: hypothetical protein NTV48_02290 [Candidatus Vogelbacteria bacterium]|nr:hypothetical protein [Candidatus Vogelbacteria bacterium]